MIVRRWDCDFRATQPKRGKKDLADGRGWRSRIRGTPGKHQTLKTNVVLMLTQRRRRWANIKTTLGFPGVRDTEIRRLKNPTVYLAENSWQPCIKGVLSSLA